MKKSANLGQHIVITGASFGIGRALALEMAAPGRHLTLIARTEERLNELAALIEKKGAKAHVLALDLGILKNASSWVESAEAKAGPIDSLILNAGVQKLSLALDLTDEEREEQLALNVMSPLRSLRHIAPKMCERGFGNIVLLSSVSAFSPAIGMADYAAGKAYLSVFAETLRHELKGSGVSLLVVYPGPVRTALERNAREKLEDRFLVRHLPTGEAAILAKQVDRAVQEGKGILIYPKFYELTRWANQLSRWVSLKLSPPLREKGGG